MSSRWPFVSVVVLNYNGLRYLDGCLGSLERLDYPHDRYEVVLVDNVSGDGSVEVAEKRYPFVRVVRNDRNLGFAGGNNVAMRSTAADYVVLLNNDTEVEPGWLGALARAAEEDPRAGACTSKLLFRHDRVRVRLSVDRFRPSEHGSADDRALGVQIFSAETEQDGDVQPAEYLEGFHGQEASPRGGFRWSAPEAVLGLRVRRDGGPAVLRLRVAAPRAARVAVEFTTRTRRHQGRHEGEEIGLGEGPSAIEVEVPEEVVRSATPVIQNAGTLILRGGAGRDRGAVVRGTEVVQEDDEGQYDRREEVFAGCGAALLLRRATLEDVGVFDDDFFMYYEDMDLSWRMRRRGWKVLYVPDAVVRHVHCGSSVEWSPLFVFHVERNRLLMLGKNAPAGVAASEWLRYFGGVALDLGRFLRAFVRRSPDLAAVHGRAGIRLRVAASLLGLLPSTLAKRRALRRRDTVPEKKLMEWVAGG